MTNSRLNPHLNPNSSEYSPALAHHEKHTALSSEELAGYNASLYGFIEPVRTIESYGNEGIDVADLNRLRGDMPNTDIRKTSVEANDIASDALTFENKANDTLTKVGLGEAANGSNVTDVAATEVALAEQLDVGTESSSEEILRAEHALVAATFARTIEKGDLEPFKSLKDAGVANDISYRLHELRQRYGSASYAPLDELAVVGALIDYAKKTSAEDDDKIIESKDGHVQVEDVDELSERANEGDADAVKQLIESDKADEIVDAIKRTLR